MNDVGCWVYVCLWVYTFIANCSYYYVANLSI